ncbi:MAG: ferrous iron transport protein A [Firmicutes bacterium]|nr:ferrous iron transport protein A [Bacillota bacterium]
MVAGARQGRAGEAVSAAKNGGEIGGDLRLCDLPMGEAGIVGEILAGGIVRRRLLDLGLVPGTRVYAVRRSPAGDPTAFRIRGAVIALRREEAARVRVCPAQQLDLDKGSVTGGTQRSVRSMQ